MEKQNNAETPEIPFPEELTHMDEILVHLREALAQAEKRAKEQEEEYKEAKRYMALYRNEIDPKEIFQAERMQMDIAHSGMLAVKEQENQEKLLDSPYFSRIDFKADGDQEDKLYYIGKFAFRKDRKILIYDWRAPVSSMFYDCELGRAGYTAPIGEIKGDLNRKRQFKIKNSVMEYALESSMQIQDDVLQKELSTTSDEKMKTIIATLQREQNAIIRSEKTGAMIIQGVAGSGKTSIALHRVAYLLYRHKKTLAANNVVILSPNKVFGDFIANVLPELGEDPIYEMSFEDVAEVQLRGLMDFDSEGDPTEVEEGEKAERIRFKSTMDFANKLKEFVERTTEEMFTPADYVYDRFVVPADYIAGRYTAYKRFPVEERISQIIDDIFDKFLDWNVRGVPKPRRPSMLKALKDMLKIKKPLDLYRQFYKELGLSKYFYMPKKEWLEWADVYPFMYVYSKYTGLKRNRMIKHVVVDEMQDYTPTQYMVINILFDCQKTILGDFGQSVNPNNLNTLEDMRCLYPQDELVELNKSYRSSYEIINFAKRILKVAKLEPVERHGEEVVLKGSNSYEDTVQEVKKAIKGFMNGKNNSLGIITKTGTAAEKLYSSLKDEFEINLLTPESDKFLGGITLSSIKMSKGLEFDEVIIPFADKEEYYTDRHRNLLYIACTRAMHKLSLFYTGSITELID